MSQPKKYKVQVVSVANPVENIYTVEFRSLSGRFKYLPGQFMHLALDDYDPSFGWPESRCFSMQSSPDMENLKITYSVKGHFTIRMASELVQEKVLYIKLPYGELFQQDHSREQVVFIAGGTGITPFLSLFTCRVFEKYSTPSLYFGLKKREFHLYKSEIEFSKKINPSMIIYTKYEEEDGILNCEEIFQENGLNKLYFISGPQQMITFFRSSLVRKGLNPESIKTDEWI